MAAINSLTKVSSVLFSNPVVFVPVILLYLLSSVQTIPQSLSPSVGGLIAIGVSGLLILITPLFHGGTIGMINEAATSGQTSLESFLSYSKQYYFSVLGAYLIFLAIFLVLSIVASVAAMIGAVGLVAMESLAVLAIAVVVGMVFVGLYIGFSLALQFYAHAIVIEDYSAVDSLSRSLRVVKQNLRSVLGYFAILIGGGLLVLTVYGGVIWISPVEFFAQPGTVSLSMALLESLITLVVLSPIGAAYLVYSVLFYRSLLGEPPVTTGSSESTIAAVDRSASADQP